ncbi:MAG TPA: Rieske (2Fe-2S) protein [Stellaceae bacterium]|jgi:nitrite reductase/ring-hydroxylating ferredoxin subunit
MSEILVGAISEFPDNDYRILDIDGFEVGVFRRGDALYVYENRCPHFGGPVCQGKVLKRVEERLSETQASRGLRFAGDEHIICPWHGVEFDLKTGRNFGHAQYRLRKIPARIKDDEVYLDIPE